MLWLDLGLVYSCPTLCQIVFREHFKDSAHLFLHIAKCRGVRVPVAVNIERCDIWQYEFSRGPNVSQFFFISVFFPLSKWNSCKILETLLFKITRADFPSCWQHPFCFLLMRKGSFWFSLPTTEVGKKNHCDIYHFLIYNLSEILPCPNTDVLHSSSLSRQIEYTDFRNLFFVRSFSTFQPLSSFWIHLHQNKYCSRWLKKLCLIRPQTFFVRFLGC